jgi:hypothetical protein
LVGMKSPTYYIESAEVDPREADIDDGVSYEPASVQSSKLVKCPFDDWIDGALHDSFYDVRDALGHALVAKRNNPKSTIVVSDMRTGRLTLEVEP